MSLFGVIMDIILAGLLMGALAFGVRLNARLKTLQSGREDFAKAVAELDQAAIRAHEALRQLRAHADESQDLLHGRILAARELLPKLETLITRAERTQSALEKIPPLPRSEMTTHEVSRPRSLTERPEVMAPPMTTPKSDPFGGLTPAEIIALLREARGETAGVADSDGPPAMTNTERPLEQRVFRTRRVPEGMQRDPDPQAERPRRAQPTAIAARQRRLDADIFDEEPPLSLGPDQRVPWRNPR